MTEYEKIIPSHWIYSNLGEVCQTTSGGTPSRKNSLFYEGNIPWVKSGELNYNTILETEEHISEDAIKKSSAKVFPKGTLLIALYGATIGKLAILGTDAATNQAVCAIFKNEIFDSKFLYHLLFHKRQDLVKEGIGGAQPNISQTILKNLEVPICPLPEQRAIVLKIEQLFSELDNGIFNLKLAQEQLKVYRQAVLKKAFEGELTKKWREQQTDLPDAEDLLEQIKKEREEAAKVSSNKGKKIKPLTGTELADLPMIPKKWMWVKLDSLGDLGRGKSKHRPRNDKILFGGKYPFIQTGEVKAANHIIKSFEKTYSDVGLAQSKLWPKGTLCITIAANIAETAFLGFESCFPDSIVGFTATENIVMKEYIYYFFKGNQSKIEAFAPATAQKNINLTTLENLIIPYCSLPEQQAIVQEIETRLSVCDKIEQDIKDNLEKAEALRQSILKKAFEGKLLNEKELAEVREAEDWEPAEVLLERVKAEKTASGKKDRS